MTFLDILLRRSSKNAAVPKVQPGPPPASTWSNAGAPIRPLERNIEVNRVVGLLNEQCHVETRYMGADGELIYCIEDHGGLVLGCGHHGTAHISVKEATCGRGIAGVCVYCAREYQPLVEKGEIDALQAERLSLVCNECARMTTAGHLCCPRHATKVTAEDGTIQYIDPDTAKSAARQNTIAKAVGALMCLFGEPQEQQEQRTNRE